ncbi:MAG: DUF2851 family protein, partial [Flammeovirgaceae bacterium]|nr:DUF2851 family protein [Flammeovirgaceae bacterium]MDW8287357.1 DUF2851 family protein [Flammeovirgaceae bacterium]
MKTIPQGTNFFSNIAVFFALNLFIFVDKPTKTDMITEKFISYLWMFQKFDRRALSTSQGDRIEVLSVGVLNRDAGADFTRARLLIDGMEWVGDIEIHVRSSDWKKHGHRSNAAYNSVILQVVWEKDEEVFREDQSVVPTLELCHRVSKDELEKWEKFIENPSAIACASHWKNVDASVKQTMLHKALEERMYRKALAVLQMFAETQHDWDETAYRWVASNFGFKVNNQPFEMLAKAVPLKVLQHHADRLVSIEALLFGQSGLLPLRDEAQDAYVEELYREYRFLAHKFQLSTPVAAHTWKFARIRPANFPTVRIAQLACFLHRYPRFFSMLLETTDLRSLQKLFLEIQVSPYWQH